MPTRSAPQAVIQEVLAILDEIRTVGIVKQAFRQEQIPFWQHRGIQQRIRRLAKTIVTLNPRMLSVSDVDHALHYPLLSRLIDEHLYDDYGPPTLMTPEGFVRRELERLINFERWTDLEIPILHLPAGPGDTISWGEVSFRSFNPWSELEAQKSDTDFTLKGLVDSYDGRFNGMAAMRAPGDATNAWETIRDAATAALREIIGATWPKHLGEGFVAPSVAGRGADTGYTPVFHQGSTRFAEGRLHPGHPPARYAKDAPEIWGGEAFALFDGVVSSTDSQRTDLQRRVLASLRWLGAACEPDVPAMRVVKIATALESLVSDRGEDPFATQRGTTATLAERTAFLASDKLDERLATHHAVSELYQFRSRALHQNQSVDIDKLGEWGNLVWSAARAALLLTPTLSTDKDLRTWTEAQRYSGGTPLT